MTVPRSAPVAANGADALFTPVQLGPYTLKHRIVYAPLTRCRAFNNVPQPNAATYYGQRATEGGLIISEGTVISEQGRGYPCTPGLYTTEQVEAWKPIVEAVHAKGAIFFSQIWHTGRASHPDYQPNEELPVGPSAKAVGDGTQTFSLKTMQMEDYPVPRALDASEIPAIIDQYRVAAANAIAAGFDGVEIHGANGYLIDQFLKDNVNDRTDEWGGSIENRCRFALEVVKAVAGEIGANKTGLRLSPFGGFLDVSDSHPYALTTYLLEELAKLDLAYVHLVEPRTAGVDDVDPGRRTLAPFRAVYPGTLIVAGGYNRDDGAAAIESGRADLICYGRHFLSNPDLPLRFKLGAPLNKYDRATFYTQGEEGYLDYPFLEQSHPEWVKEHLKN